MLILYFVFFKRRYVFSCGGGGEEGLRPQRGGSYLFVTYSREQSHTFPEFFNEDFCDVALHFPYRLSFSFHLF